MITPSQFLPAKEILQIFKEISICVQVSDCWGEFNSKDESWKFMFFAVSQTPKLDTWKTEKCPSQTPLTPVSYSSCQVKSVCD